MGSLCIIGVDEDRVLKDFVRAHVEMLPGRKVLLTKWYPDLAHNGETIRVFYGRSFGQRATSLLPHALHTRMQSGEREQAQINRAFDDFFHSHDVDVVLAEFGPTGADIVPHLKRLDIPLVVHFHGHDAHRSLLVDEYRDKYRQMFEYATGVVSVSRRMTEALVELGAPASRITYNPYGPRERFFNIQPDYSPTVLALGRFTDIKANYLTLAAFAQATRDLPDTRLVMVGDGELLETCKTLAHVWGVEDRVRFTGAVKHTDTGAFFRHASCFAQHSVVPSYGDSEGTPVTILEAQAAGLPVVATAHAGIPDVVKHGETGFLVQERDVTGMAAYLRKLLMDQALAVQMGSNARKHIAANFSIAKHISTLTHVVEDARSRRRA